MVIFMVEEYGYSAEVIATSATKEQILEWWEQGGKNRLVNGEWTTCQLPGEILDRKPVCFLSEFGPHSTFYPVVDNEYLNEFPHQVKEGEIVIHTHMGSDDWIWTGEEYLDHPQAEQFDDHIWGEGAR